MMPASSHRVTTISEKCQFLKMLSKIYHIIYITLISPGQGHLPKRAEMKT